LVHECRVVFSKKKKNRKLLIHSLNMLVRQLLHRLWKARTTDSSGKKFDFFASFNWSRPPFPSYVAHVVDGPLMRPQDPFLSFLFPPTNSCITLYIFHISPSNYFSLNFVSYIFICFIFIYLLILFCFQLHPHLIFLSIRFGHCSFNFLFYLR
jgi:hypothetical protein